MAGVMWSLNGLFIKGFDLPAMTIAFYRSVFAGLLFAPFLMSSRQKKPFSWVQVGAVGSYVVVVSLFVWANKLTTSANAIVLQYTAPLFVMVWSVWFLKESLTQANVWCLIVAMIGMGVIVVGGHGTPDMMGILVAVASGLAFSWYMVFQRFLSDESPFRMVAFYNLATVVCLIPWVWGKWQLTNIQLVGLVVMGVVQLGIPYVLFAKGLQSVRPQEASLITLVEPVLNPIWVFLAWKETPAFSTLVGGGCIMAALIGRFAFQGKK